jgi:hypothetical protein
VDSNETATFLSQSDEYQRIYVYSKAGRALLLASDGEFAMLSEHVAVDYTTPEGPCSVLNDGRCCFMSGTEFARSFPPEQHASAEAAATYLRAEWEARWG